MQRLFILGFITLISACGSESDLTNSRLGFSEVQSQEGSGSSSDDSTNSGGDASLHPVRLRCEQRSDRSKVSVDLKGLDQGSYYAVIQSGTSQATSPIQTPIYSEVEFDFDSDSDDILAGATAIAWNFIQGGVVQANVYTSASELVGSAQVTCLQK